MIRAFVLAITLISLPSNLVAQTSCSVQFQPRNQGLEAILQRVEKLNPDLASEFYKLPQEQQNLMGLYKLLKLEGWRVSKLGMIPRKDAPEIAPVAIESMKANFSKKFTTQSLSKEDLYIFYVNGVQDLYIQTTEAIKNNFIRSVLPEKVDNGVKSFISQVYDNIIPPTVNQREISVERGLEIFGESLKTEINWNLLADLAQRFYTQDRIDFDSVDSWLEQQPQAKGLTKEETQLFRREIKAKPDQAQRRKQCCVNTPGCTLCPKNRGFLKEK